MEKLRIVYPSINIKGCVFHWVQALWKNVQAIGLQSSYTNDPGKHQFIRRLMALPYLPPERIPAVFEILKAETDEPKLQEFLKYIEDNWINSRVWPPSTWSVFMQRVRTNNNTEGWHNRLNIKATRPNVQFYLLVDLLFKEASYVRLQKELIQLEKLKTHQCTRYQDLNLKLFQLWGQYNLGKKTNSQLIKACAKLFGTVE